MARAGEKKESQSESAYTTDAEAISSNCGSRFSPVAGTHLSRSRIAIETVTHPSVGRLAWPLLLTLNR